MIFKKKEESSLLGLNFHVQLYFRIQMKEGIDFGMLIPVGNSTFVLIMKRSFQSYSTRTKRTLHYLSMFNEDTSRLSLDIPLIH